MGEEMKGRAAEMRTVDESVFFFFFFEQKLFGMFGYGQVT